MCCFYSVCLVLGRYQRELHPDVRTVHSDLQTNSNHVIRLADSSLQYIRLHSSFFDILNYVGNVGIKHQKRYFH